MAFRPDFQIQTSKKGTLRSLALAGELDGAAADALAREFELAIAESDYEELILDMQKISFIDSAGMRAIILIEQAARDRQVPLVVMPPPVAVSELLRTAGLSERLTLGPLPEGAVDASFIERIDLALPRDPTAPGRARAEIRSLLAQLGEDELSVVTLLTSELVTNAVIHPPQPEVSSVGLRIITAPTAVRVEVTDAGPGFDPARPKPREPDRGGRGLLLVDRLASRWGAGGGDDSRFCVWFELDAQVESAQEPDAISA